MTKSDSKKKNIRSKKSESKYTQSQKIIKKGGQSEENRLREILSESSESLICDLSKANPYFYSGIYPVNIKVIKKKNGFNKPSYYIAFKIDSNEIFVSALGKEEFYEKFISNKQGKIDSKSPNNQNFRKKVEEAIIALKIIQFFGKNYDKYNSAPFGEEFNDLNKYFRMKDIVK